MPPCAKWCASILIWDRWAVIPPRCHGQHRSSHGVAWCTETKEGRPTWSWRACCAICCKNWTTDWHHRYTRIHVPWSSLQSASGTRIHGHDCSRFACANRSGWPRSDSISFYRDRGPDLNAHQSKLKLSDSVKHCLYYLFESLSDELCVNGMSFTRQTSCVSRQMSCVWMVQPPSGCFLSALLLQLLYTYKYTHLQLLYAFLRHESRCHMWHIIP